MHLKHLTSLAVATIALAGFTGLASASPTYDNINGNATVEPNTYITYSIPDIGWAYTPGSNYMLTGITSDFSSGNQNSNTVTLDFYSGIPNSGTATLLGSGTFTSGTGVLGVTFGSNIALTSGTTYFVGLVNTGGIGVNMVQSAFSVTSGQPVAPGVTYIPSGFYSDFSTGDTDFNTNSPLVVTSCGCNNAFAAPILNFQGFQPTSVPEPSSLALSLAGIAALGWIRRRNS